MKKFLIIILGIVLFFSGCERKGGDQKVADQNKTKVIKIGAILPLTGPVASFGQWIKNGIEVAIESYPVKNSNIKVFYEDSKFDAKTGVLAFQKLLNKNHIDLVITAMSKVAIPIIKSNKNQIPLLLQDVTYPNITAMSDNIFRHFIQSDREAKIMARFMQTKGCSNIGITYINDEAGLGAYKSLLRDFSDKMIKSVAFSRNSDFRAIATRIIANAPDCLYVYGNGPSWAQMMKSIKELGYQGAIYTNTAMYIPVFRKIAGNALEEVYFTYPAVDTTSKVYRDFRDRYYVRFHQEPQLEAIYAYDLMRFIIKTAQSFPSDAIAKALKKMTSDYSDSIFKDLKIQQRDFITKISIGKMHNGHIIEVY